MQEFVGIMCDETLKTKIRLRKARAQVVSPFQDPLKMFQQNVKQDKNDKNQQPIQKKKKINIKVSDQVNLSYFFFNYFFSNLSN